ncbi:hypothetical protein VCUG_02133 [Vavraia culicis subsp. floridensis]|uniref:Uncharacterized protein n=1 Tax=Vavraia culicis (isolate floridensis) TaxID=948595 RepID=L2GRY1_VAVCU|nr:uncharacterized protein VCUG_02133 [Vavraia culicis subsp. floridensis]ELA46369.1 hypothetical protein VCUG_02133 [Vavraia culicis subsp. floridensis]
MLAVRIVEYKRCVPLRAAHRIVEYKRCVPLRAAHRIVDMHRNAYRYELLIVLWTCTEMRTATSCSSYQGIETHPSSKENTEKGGVAHTKGAEDVMVKQNK